jgi:hypothetical protein
MRRGKELIDLLRCADSECKHYITNYYDSKVLFHHVKVILATQVTSSVLASLRFQLIPSSILILILPHSHSPRLFSAALARTLTSAPARINSLAVYDTHSPSFLPAFLITTRVLKDNFTRPPWQSSKSCLYTSFNELILMIKVPETLAAVSRSSTCVEVLALSITIPSSRKLIQDYRATQRDLRGIHQSQADNDRSRQPSLHPQADSL